MSAKYLLALLNSKLIYFWLYYRGKRKGETLELYATPLSEIPIAETNTATPFTTLVSYLLFLYNSDKDILGHTKKMKG